MRKALLASSLSVAAGLTLSAGAIAQRAETVDPTAPFISQPQPRSAGGGMVPSGTSPCGASIYQNGPLVNSAGTGPGGTDQSLVQDNTLGMSIWGFAHANTGAFRIADDFTVPAGGMNLGCVVLYAYQTGSTSTSSMNAVNLRIWNGQPGAAGSTVVFGDTTTNRLLSTSWTNIYRGLTSAPGDTQRPIMAQVVDLQSLNLPAGTYWLDWQTGGTLGSGPWAPPITINGQSSTGNALQFDGTNWVAVTDGGPQGMPFALLGVPGPVLPPPLVRPAVIPANDGFGLGLLALLTLGFAGWSLQRRR